MAITRSKRYTRASSPKTHLIGNLDKSHANPAGPHQLPVANGKKRKIALSNELAALGVFPKPDKKQYDGPGERGTGSRFTEEGTQCMICAETQTQQEFPEASTMGPCSKHLPKSKPTKLTPDTALASRLPVVVDMSIIRKARLSRVGSAAPAHVSDTGCHGMKGTHANGQVNPDIRTDGQEELQKMS
ncbi:MAG: hypothetical protein Q9215_000496 [Flavoplaca cf. flavocitrina]